MSRDLSDKQKPDTKEKESKPEENISRNISDKNNADTKEKERIPGENIQIQETTKDKTEEIGKIREGFISFTLIK